MNTLEMKEGRQFRKRFQQTEIAVDLIEVLILGMPNSK